MDCSADKIITLDEMRKRLKNGPPLTDEQLVALRDLMIEVSNMVLEDVYKPDANKIHIPQKGQPESSK